MTFSSKLYPEFVAELEQEIEPLLLTREKLQEGDAKNGLLALWFC